VEIIDRLTCYAVHTYICGPNACGAQIAAYPAEFRIDVTSGSMAMLLCLQPGDGGFILVSQHCHLSSYGLESGSGNVNLKLN